ncbi:MAG: methyltransferase [Halioglobus sp.]
MSKRQSPHRRSRKQLTSKGQGQPQLWGKDCLEIERMSQEGRGVASRRGKVVFVTGALAGEQVRVQCTAVRRDCDEADMLELAADSAPSAQRVLPECPIYGQCGGCTLQHWSPAAQRQHKEASLQAALRRVSPTLALDSPITSPYSGFRHRLRLLVTRGSGGSYILALRQRRSHAAAEPGQCLIAVPPVNRLLQALPGILAGAPDLQGLREIEIDADSESQLGVCLYFAANPGERILSALAGMILDNGVVSLRAYLNTRKQPDRAVQNDHAELEETGAWQELLACGELCLRLEAPRGATTGELCLSYLPGDFTQTNLEVNSALVRRAMDWLQPTTDEVALDLFCGIGNFSLALARRAQSVHAMEGDSAMVRRVVSNAQRNTLANLRVRTCNLLADDVQLPAADIAVLDPPRSGARAVCAALARSGVARLVYVSCHPATLLRDAEILRAAGLQLSRAAAVDMFPHSGHSEAITLFTRI